MEYIKLQLGCLMVIAYIVFLYYKEHRRFQLPWTLSLFDVLLTIGIACMLLDGLTAYTVNHLDTVNETLNRILHGLFLSSVDAVIFIQFLYILDETEGMDRQRGSRKLLFLPFAVNILLVFLFLPELEYRHGRISNYSMGISAYTCYVMAAIYILLTIGIVFRRWKYIEGHKRTSILTCLLVIVLVTGYQMMVPDSLLTSIGTLIILLGAYLNLENPALKELGRYHDEMVMGFATLIENRDDSTGGHVKRTTQYVKLLVEELRHRGYYKEILTQDYIRNLQMAAPMHDVGKISIPDAILQKPGKLTAEEFDVMKQHTVRGGRIIQETFSRMGNRQYLEMAWQIARYHHEKWNGNGYPEGLKGEEIPLCARIMAIADVFDAVSEKRCYRDALPLEKCFEIIRVGCGRDFDPLLTEVFLDLQEKVIKVHRGQENHRG